MQRASFRRPYIFPEFKGRTILRYVWEKMDDQKRYE